MEKRKILRRRKVVCIIQARMGSTRLPGKVLLPLMGRPILKRLIDRVKQVEIIDEIIIATSTNPKDKAIVNFCKDNNVLCYRGPENDIMSRIEGAIKASKAKIIVDITGDCPLVDPVHIASLTSMLIMNKLDYVSNCFPRQFFDGADCQVYTREIFEKINKCVTNPTHRSHSGWNIVEYAHHLKPKKVKIWTLLANDNEYRPNLRLTIDYPEDYTLIFNIFQYFKENETFGVADIMQYLDENPHLLKINEKRLSKVAGEG